MPDRLEADGRMGIFPGETVEAMHWEFEETVRTAAAADPWLAESQTVLKSLAFADRLKLDALKVTVGPRI